MGKGRNKYVPRIVIEEVVDIREEHKIKTDAEAMREMANYSQVGREVERMMKLNFKHKPRRKKRDFII